MESKKRKVSENMLDKPPQSKRLRGKPGSLKDLVEMPVDVLGEIFSQLDPNDLLNLARTKKNLRAFLMSRSSASIWKRSRSNIPGLPDCPSDLSEPQYANLAFAKNCHFCLRNLSSIHISWDARLRTCTKCMSVRFKFVDTEDSKKRGYPIDLAHRLPSIKSTNPDDDDLYYSRLDRLWKKDYETAKDKQKWLATKIEERRKITLHANACAIWYKNMERISKMKKQSLIEANKAIILERLKTLGWEEELSKISEEADRPENIPKVVKACQKELTERVLLNLEKCLIEHMEELQRRRLRKERHTMLKNRLPILKDVYETHVSSLPANALYPTASEVFRNPIVQGIINNTPLAAFTKTDIEVIVPLIPHITRQWQREIEDKLRLLITGACGPEYSFDPEKVLHLATTWFSCGTCLSGRYLTHPRVLVHSCATIPRRPPSFGVDEELCRDTLRQMYWNSTGTITFEPEDLKLMVDIVEMCGFDSKTTTSLEMEKANPILECVPCNDMHKGRATLKWSAIIDHKHKAHEHIEMKLELLKGPEAELARARMNEEQERRYAAKNYRNMICVHCKTEGNTIGLMQHAMKDHGILKPKREDVVPLIDSNQIPSPFYLWPPRLEECHVEPRHSMIRGRLSRPVASLYD